MAMDKILVHGGATLQGSVRISGSKNSALPILAATLLTREQCIIHHVPDLSDINYMLQILSMLGAEVERASGTVTIKAENIKTHAPYEIVRKMRASVCVLGPLLGREKEATVALPGGCVIGDRPIDLHLRGFEALGREGAHGRRRRAAVRLRTGRGQHVAARQVRLDRAGHRQRDDGRRARRGHHGHRGGGGGAGGRRSGEFPQCHGRTHRGRGHPADHHRGRQGTPRRGARGHPRPDRGGHIHGGRSHLRGRRHAQKRHPRAPGIHLRAAARGGFPRGHDAQDGDRPAQRRREVARTDHRAVPRFPDGHAGADVRAACRRPTASAR